MDYLATHTSLLPIWRWCEPGFVNYKKGVLDSQPQVIKFTSFLPMVGGSLRVPEFFKFIGPGGQKITRSANNVGNAGPRVRQTFLNDVFTFLTEVGNAGHIVNTGTSSVNSD